MQEKRPDIASKIKPKLSVQAHQILPVFIHGDQYAIDLIFVESVLPLMSLQQAPNNIHYLAGLMDYRGKNIPVVDLGMWLGIKPTGPYNLDTPVVVCRNGQKKAAFIVSDVMQVEVVEARSIMTQNTFEENDVPIETTMNLNTHQVPLFDMKRILAMNFAIVDSHLSADNPIHRPETHY